MNGFLKSFYGFTDDNSDSPEQAPEMEVYNKLHPELLIHAIEKAQREFKKDDLWSKQTMETVVFQLKKHINNVKNLRAVVDKLTPELDLYKKCLAVLESPRSRNAERTSALNEILNSINTVVQNYVKSLQSKKATSMSIQAISAHLTQRGIKHIVVSADTKEPKISSLKRSGSLQLLLQTLKKFGYVPTDDKLSYSNVPKDPTGSSYKFSLTKDSTDISITITNTESETRVSVSTGNGHLQDKLKMQSSNHEKDVTALTVSLVQRLMSQANKD